MTKTQIKAKAVQLVRAGAPVAQVASELQVPKSTLYAWLKKADHADWHNKPSLWAKIEASLWTKLASIFG